MLLAAAQGVGFANNSLAPPHYSVDLIQKS
jgi:hypothetical protein